MRNHHTLEAAQGATALLLFAAELLHLAGFLEDGGAVRLHVLERAVEALLLLHGIGVDSD